MTPLSDTSDIVKRLDEHPPIAVGGMFAAGEMFGSWRIEAFIARGGSGEVYRVVNEKTSVEAALKVSSLTGISSARLLREADYLEKNHLVFFPRFFERGERNGSAYFIMELLDPFEMPQKEREIAELLIKVGEAVAALHGQGLVHRDIKPSNIMRRRRNDGSFEPVLIDLGLLKKSVELEKNKSNLTVTIVDGKAVGSGTPRYAAPEQFNGGDISPAADIHALGILANECFGGRPSFGWKNIIRRATSSIAKMRYQRVTEFTRAVRRRNLFRNLCVAAVFFPAFLSILFFIDVRSVFEHGTDRGDLKTGGKYREQAILFGEALGAPQYKWETTEKMPWYVIKSPGYEGGAAVEASGGGGGEVETYLKTVVSGAAKRMTFRFQRSYFMGIFSVEIDGKAAFSDTSISRDEGDNWRAESVDIPAGQHEVKFKYRHAGIGYRNKYNGVRLDTVAFADVR